MWCNGAGKPGPVVQLSVAGSYTFEVVLDDSESDTPEDPELPAHSRGRRVLTPERWVGDGPPGEVSRKLGCHNGFGVAGARVAVVVPASAGEEHRGHYRSDGNARDREQQPWISPGARRRSRGSSLAEGFSRRICGGDTGGSGGPGLRRSGSRWWLRGSRDEELVLARPRRGRSRRRGGHLTALGSKLRALLAGGVIDRVGELG